jgi:hypothetical protein
MMMVMRVESEGVWWWCVIVSIGGRKGGVTASSRSLVGGVFVAERVGIWELLP